MALNQSVGRLFIILIWKRNYNENIEWFEILQPTGNITAGVVPTVFGNTHRNQFRGPGQSVVNASAFRSFPIYRELKFEVRVEAFNLLNHPILDNPNTTVGGANFGYITSFGASRTLQYSGRITF
jgi:hypothetical protein